MLKFNIDGVDYDTSTPEFVQALTQHQKRTDTKIATLEAERDKAAAERDAAIKDREDAKTKLAEASDPKRLDSLVSDRLSLIDRARRVLGPDADLTGKTERDVMIDTIRHDDSSFNAEGKSDDYVRAYFEASTKSATRHDEGGNGIGAARSAAVDATKTKDKSRTDSGEQNEERIDAAEAQRRMHANNAAAAAQPLRFSRE